MAITSNQLTDIFQSQIGRSPTNFETKKYANTSIQDLANIKNNFSKLNPDKSISDYLEHTGQDNSLQARTALAAKYGITGIGTAAGNIALLTALKKGPPTATPPVPVTGSVGTATGQTPPIVTPDVKATTDQVVPNNGTSAGIPNTDPNNPNKNNPVLGTGTDENKATMGGSVGAAASSTQSTPPANDGTIDTDPDVYSAKTNVDNALKSYTDAQQQVGQIDSQIATLRTSMTQVVNDIKEEAAKSGSFITESQANEIASQRTTAIQGQINDLLTQRGQYATAQSQSATALTQARTDYKNAQDAFFKGASLSQGQQKISNQSNQFTAKLEQSGWKQQKVNVYDEYGNVTGQQLVWTQNPGATSGVDSDGNSVTITTGNAGPGVSSSGGGTLTPAQNNPGALKYTAYTASLGAKDSGIKASDGGTYASFDSAITGQKAQISLLKSGTYSNMTVQDAMQKYSHNGYGAEVAPGIPPDTKMKDLSADQLNQLATDIQTREGVSGSSTIPTTAPLYTGSSVNATSPGYATATVKYGGKDTQLTQAYIDKIAIAAIENGGTIPSSAARGTKGLPIVQTDAIKARIGQLDPGGNLIANKAQATAWGKALSTQIDYATKLSRSLASADADFKQVIDTYGSTGINSGVPISNLINNATQYNLGDADIAAFRSSLAEISRLYSQVFASSGGQTTDATNKTAQDIINGNMSMDQLKAVQAQLQALGKIDVQKANDSITQTVGNISGIAGGNTNTSSENSNPIPKGSTSNSDYVNQVLTANGYKYDDYIKQVPPGKIPVINNADGTIGYLDNDSEYDASIYTRI